MPVRSTSVTIYSLTEAARLIGVSRWTLNRAVKEGKLVAHQNRNSTLIFANDLLEYVIQYRNGRGIPLPA